MNTADYVDSLVADLQKKVADGGIPLSDAAWEVCLACVDWSYVYSAWGALCTPSERRKRFGMCPTHTTIKTKCKAFDSGVCTGCQWYPDGQRTRCFDCRGFTDWILKQFGFDLYGDTVSAQWNHKENWIIKGEFGVDPVPQNVLVNVFIKKDGKWTHTGFYYNGATCECSVGVQHFDPMKKNRWTHWAIAACFKNGWTLPVEPPKEPEKQPEKEPVKVNYKTIKRGNYGELVKTCQTILQSLGYNLGICGVDGDFGSATEKAVKAFQKDHGLKQDGIVGEKTWSALLSAEPQANPATYTATISHLSEEEVSALRVKYPNCIITKE